MRKCGLCYFGGMWVGRLCLAYQGRAHSAFWVTDSAKTLGRFSDPRISRKPAPYGLTLCDFRDAGNSVISSIMWGKDE